MVLQYFSSEYIGFFNQNDELKSMQYSPLRGSYCIDFNESFWWKIQYTQKKSSVIALRDLKRKCLYLFTITAPRLPKFEFWRGISLSVEKKRILSLMCFHSSTKLYQKYLDTKNVCNYVLWNIIWFYCQNVFSWL